MSINTSPETKRRFCFLYKKYLTPCIMNMGMPLFVVLWIVLAFTVLKSVFMTIWGIMISIICTAFLIYNLKVFTSIIRDKKTDEEYVKGLINNITVSLFTPVAYEGFWGYTACLEIYIDNEKYYLPRSVMNYIQVGDSVSISFKPLSKVVLTVEIID